MANLKTVGRAVRQFNQDESHGSSKNPGLKENRSGSFKNNVSDTDTKSGSKQSDLSRAAASIYKRAEADAPDPSRIGDQAMRDR